MDERCISLKCHVDLFPTCRPAMEWVPFSEGPFSGRGEGGEKEKKASPPPREKGEGKERVEVEETVKRRQNECPGNGTIYQVSPCRD